MKGRVRCSGGVLALVLLPLAQAQQVPAPSKAVTPGNILAALGGGSTDALAGSLRGFLIKSLPNPLYEDSRHWGQQKPVRDLRWRGKGLHAHPEEVQVLKNDGHWWKVRATANRLADNLVFDLRDVQQPEEGRMTFTAFLSFDTDVEFERQHWREGTRLRSSSIRARLRLKFTLRCEATGRVEVNGLLPEAVFRLRVVQAESGYDNLVVEHIAGVGGSAAKLIGEAAHSSINQWRPSLERDLLAKADAAIVKAGDTKEVRVSLSKLLSKK
jgi:hypothetical protein